MERLVKDAPRPGPKDPKWFRRVLGQVPTGVTAVTATSDDEPVGMIVGTFTSVSLDPPLVAFFPGKESTTWPRIAESGAFCVNVLGADQESVCQSVMSKSPDKFDAVDWHHSALTGSPVIRGAIAWIECKITRVSDAGDHWLVMGEVLDLDIGSPEVPLVFFRGGFGRGEAVSRVASTIDFGPRLQALNSARPTMEALANDLGCECVAAAHIGDEIVLIGSAGTTHGRDLPSRVGERVPALAPFGRSIIAWTDNDTIERWLRSVADPDSARAHKAMLKSIRDRGYSVTVISSAADERVDFEDDGRLDLRSVLDPGVEATEAAGEGRPIAIAIPVLDKHDRPLFALALYGLDASDVIDADELAARLGDVAAAAQSSEPKPIHTPNSQRKAVVS